MIRLFLLFCIFSLNANASAVRSVCTDYTSNLCMKVIFAQNPNSQDEGKFTLSVQTPNNTQLQQLSAKLWMNMGHHGHGSAPLDISEIATNQYQIKNAWFVMTGEWQIQVEFTLNSESYSLSLPVQIQN